MKAYAGGLPSRAVRELLIDAGIGTILQPGFAGELRRWRGAYRVLDHLRFELGYPFWAYDNGAFAAFLQGEEWPEPEEWAANATTVKWTWELRAVADIWLQGADEMGEDAAMLVLPDFAVLPDRVGKGIESLDLSLRWLDWLTDQGIADVFAWAIVAQEGMKPDDLPWDDERWEVVFVGGKELSWKDRTAPEWCAAAHEHGRLCHIGRVGAAKRVRRMRMIADADSIDSGGVAWSMEKIRRWIAALEEPLTPGIWGPGV